MAAPFPRARYIISRYSDPVFAVFIGISAALLRIRKEEIEKRSGIPSASMVISPQQKRCMDEEREKTRSSLGKGMDLYRLSDRVDSKNDMDFRHDDLWSRGSGRSIKKREKVGYMEIITLYGQRIVWKVNYEWNGGGKELVRKDGRLV